ncbi:nuclear transport factor 2 family protein [Phenylobacterium sp.]|jgi:ketosteroid isomerase-like protein|uniref:nuclear transport factor 2 family protein n=1 Tax=Phenylobacterium sp. TaxID=1871053 RepID=UPI002F91E70B
MLGAVRGVVAALAVSSAASGAGAQAQAAAGGVVAEAQAFMAGYAQDLVKGDRAALAGRYHRDGTWMSVNGWREFVSHAQMTKDYAERWEGPKAFAWRDLAYEPAGADAVVVTGGFAWTAPDGKVQPYAYTALLKRQDGALRIRVEHETQTPEPKR